MAVVMVDTQHPLTLQLNGSVGDRELCKYVAQTQGTPGQFYTILFFLEAMLLFIARSSPPFS